MVEIVQATAPDQIAVVRALFVEYQKAIGVDLCFQDFDAELRGLPGDYAPPAGRLYLVTQDAAAVGCVGMHGIGAGRCEMKRLYVRPAARGLGVARSLVTLLMEEARRIGYVEMVLDTLPSMGAAQKLYEELGFKDIAPYRENPVAGTRYMGARLGVPA